MIPKFRYFNKLTKEMCTSDFYVTSDGRVIDTYNINSPEDMGNVAILMQSTGLKDKNGVEIFEGDRCINPKRVNREGEALVFVVEKSMRYVHEWMFEGGEVEVIGNIYEKPELLENQ